MSYTGHGGSGLTRTRADLLEMTVDEIKWEQDRLHRQREAESEAIKNKQTAK